MQVRVKFVRRTSGIPGVPGRPEPRLEGGELPLYDDGATIKEVRWRGGGGGKWGGGVTAVGERGVWRVDGCVVVLAERMCFTV